MDYPARLSELLDEIECELERLDLHEDTPPPKEALASPNPFCFDTLSMPQWLQWVFIPQMRQILALNLPLPAASRIAPAVEMHFDDLGGDSGALITLLEEFDGLMPDPLSS